MGAIAVWLGVAALIAFVAGLVTAVLPRTAHAAFERGNSRAARRRYQLLARLSPTAARRAAARVSVAACWLAGGDVERGGRALARVDERALDDAGRAAWLNNRAYAALKAGDDPAPAIAWTDEARSLRPDVPGLVHTRGLAQLAAGRIDDAIRSFEEMWELGDLPPQLEAERCRDLARAWEAKGHAEYAADYRARAARMIPGGLSHAADPGISAVALDESLD